MALAGLASVALASALTARASAQSALRTITFGSPARTANDWPVYLADKLGYFTANGLQTDVIVVGSAAAVAQQATGGSIDIGQVSTTQMIEAIEGGAPLTAVCALSSGVPYWVMGKKGIGSISQLKGKVVLVGGPNDITRVFMDTVLEKNGLHADDYTYTYIGSTGDRYAALLSGTIDATILNPPFSFRAAGEGYPLLSVVNKYFPRFVGGVYVVRTDWARAHADLVTAYLKSYLQAVRWLYDGGNKARAIQVLAEVTNTKTEDAAKTYDLYINELKYYPPTGRLAAAQIAMSQEALVKTKELKPPLAPPSKYFDNTYVDAAVAQIRRR